MAGEVGIQPSKGIIDSTVGTLCLQTREVLTQWQQAYAFFASKTDSDLANLGYDNNAVTKIRAIQMRAGELVAALTGVGTISSMHDYRTEMSQWWGHGF